MNLSTISIRLSDSFMGVIGEHAMIQRLLIASVELILLAALVGITIRLLRLRSARLRYLLWLVVLIKPFVSISLGNLVPVAVLDASTLPAQTHVSALPEQAAPLGPRGVSWSHASFAQITLLLWLAGMAVSLTRHMWAHLRLHRIIRQAEPPGSDALSRYALVAAQLHIKRAPRLVTTDDLESPAMVGVLRPVILIPRWLADQGNPARFDWAVRHELTHVQQLDAVGVLVRDLTLILFWFHPALWWVARKLTEEMELACDQAMLRSPDEAGDYAEQLFSILHGMRERRRTNVAGGLFATRTLVGRRIEVLLAGHARSGRVSASAVSIIVAVALVGLCVGGVVRTRQAPESGADENAKVNGALERSYQVNNTPEQPAAASRHAKDDWDLVWLSDKDAARPEPPGAGPTGRASKPRVSREQPMGFGGYGAERQAAPERPKGFGGYGSASKPSGKDSSGTAKPGQPMGFGGFGGRSGQ